MLGSWVLGPGASGPRGVLITSVAVRSEQKASFRKGSCVHRGASWLARAHGCAGTPFRRSVRTPFVDWPWRPTTGKEDGCGRTRGHLELRREDGARGGGLPAGPPHSRPPAKGHGAGRSARLSWGWAHYPWTAGGGACLCVDLAMNGHSHNRLSSVLLSPHQAAGRDRQPPVSGEPGRARARPARDRTDWPKLEKERML